MCILYVCVCPFGSFFTRIVRERMRVLVLHAIAAVSADCAIIRKEGPRAMGVMNVQGIHTYTHTHTRTHCTQYYTVPNVYIGGVYIHYIDKLVDLIERPWWVG